MSSEKRMLGSYGLELKLNHALYNFDFNEKGRVFTCGEMHLISYVVPKHRGNPLELLNSWVSCLRQRARGGGDVANESNGSDRRFYQNVILLY